MIVARCHNLKEQIARSRPTSSSSNFIYINPLVGVNHKNPKFQPLDEGIPEEREKGRMRKKMTNIRK